MKILLFGKNGQLGWELQRTLATLGEVQAYDFPEVDFTHPESLRAIVRSCNPQIIINAIAYTNVDKAESEPEVARLVNAASTGVIAEEALRCKAPFLHFSTDYVFDGKKGSLYVEDDPTGPLNMYGQSKLEGEQVALQVGGDVLILRTSWVYSLRQGGFVTKVLQWSRQHQVLRMVTDQVGNPTWSRALAEITAQLLARAKDRPDWLSARRGVYHLAGDGFASRFDWAKLILDLDAHPEEWKMKELLPTVTADFPSPAERPTNSALDCTKFSETFGLKLPPWQDALRLMMNIV